MVQGKRWELGSLCVAILGIGLVISMTPAVVATEPVPTWTKTDQIVHIHAGDDDPTTNFNSNFGDAIAMTDNLAVVGAAYADTVHIYEKLGDRWVKDMELSGPNGFGSSVATDGATLVVGTDVSSSEALVYQSNGGEWAKTATLTAIQAFTGCLGFEVDLSEDTIVATDPCETESAYVFSLDSGVWQLEDILKTPDERVHDVALEDGTLAIASWFGVYVYERDGDAWVLAQELDGDGVNGVDLNGDTLVSTSSWRNSVEIFAYEDEAWVLDSDVIYRDASPFNHWGGGFGASTALQGDTLVVGAPSDDFFPDSVSVEEQERPVCVAICLPHGPGSAYVFNRTDDGWEQTEKLTSPLLGEHNQFGSDVAISPTEGEILVGEPGENLATVVEGQYLAIDASDHVHAFQQT